MAETFLRFPDLVAHGVVRSKMTLHRMIRDHGFPAGRLITPNCRAWTEKEVDDWLASRPSKAKSNVARKSKTA